MLPGLVLLPYLALGCIFFYRFELFFVLIHKSEMFSLRDRLWQQTWF